VADDLVISLSADTMGFVRDMQNAAGQMKGIGAAAQQTNSLLSRMNWGMAASGLAIGLQDAASVLSNNGSFGQALNAAGNNLIQVAAMAHPVAGAVSAIVIAGVQLAPLFSNAAAEAKKLKAEAEATKKAVEATVSAHLKGAGAGAGVKDQREAFAKQTEMESRIKEARARLKAAEDLVPVTPIDSGIRNDAIRREKTSLQEMQIELAAFKEMTKDLPNVALGLTDAELPIVQQANDAVTQAKILRGEMTEIDAQMQKLHMTPGVRPEFIKQLREGLTELKEAQAEAEMEAKANDIWRGVKEKEEGWQREIALAKPEKTKIDLNLPNLSAGLVKGTVEEESFRNRTEAKQREMQQLKTMLDGVANTLLRGMEKFLPDPVPVVGGGH
jgi:hypothetical protein